jgi:RNA polymerase sporulation-specific sigma factor
MSRDELHRCFELAGRGDALARQRLITQNMRLVAHKTRHLRGKVRDIEDVLSVGLVGLIKAVDSYDPRRETPFASFACQCIENEVRMYLRKDHLRRDLVSLDRPVVSDTGELTRLDALAEDEDLAAGVLRRLEGLAAVGLVKRLAGLEREIVELRYGLRGRPPLTQREVAELKGVSRPYISRIEHRALDRLGVWLEGQEAARPGSPAGSPEGGAAGGAVAAPTAPGPRPPPPRA